MPTMQLKKIIMAGFKSFADKTEFEFGHGVTVVVGPNGCGKSNIVDAVKWVLGEQSAKSLRGGQMLDVIFNGTSNRKSMSYAEVTLVFANTKHLLNLDADEVAVTRKLYRSGDSEYLLNNKTCRLRDIKELFMDTGVGADAYSIIEQGKVATLLQASKDDRRAIFEEAAGISKFKARKKEALRKLDRTEQNVLRLTDVVGELEKRLRSIRYQAGKARNYQTYAARLKELRLNQFLAEYYQLENDLRDTKNQLAHLQNQLDSVTTDHEKIQARLAILDDELDTCQRQIRSAENDLLQCTSQISTQQERIDVGHRRCAELTELVGKNRSRINSFRDQIRQLNKEIHADQQHLEQAETDLALRQEQLDSLQHDRQQTALQLAELRAQLEDEKSGLIDIVRRTAQLHNEINSFDTQRNNLTGQKDRLHDRRGQITSEVQDLLTRHSHTDLKLQNIHALLEESQQQLEANKQQLAQVNNQRLECTENLAAAKEYRSGLLSRQQLLADLEAKLEGVDVGVRQILQDQQKDPQNFYYVRGMVADLIQADVKYAHAVEAALADRAQHLLATNSQPVLEDAEKIAELKGRVQFICPDRLPPFRNGFDFSPYPEVQAKLIDLVSFPPDCERLAWHLLGKTVLVDTIDAAIRLASIAPAGYRWVSLDGSVLDPDGTLHLGPATSTAGLISRKSELRQLDDSIAEARQRIDELQHHLLQFANQATHLEKNLQEMRTAIYEANTEKIETKSLLDQLDQNIERLKREEPLLASEIDNLESQIQDALSKQAASQKDLSDLETVNDQRQSEIDRLETAIADLDERDQITLDQITELRVDMGQTQQKRLALRERLTSAQTQLKQLNHNLNTLRTDLDNAQVNFEQAQSAILNAETRITELFHARQQHQTLSRSIRQQLETLHQEKQQLAEHARTTNTQMQQLLENVHHAQMHLSENNLRRENLTQRAHEEVGLDLADRFNDYQHEEMDWDAVANEIHDLKTKIQRLGNINLDAITEQEELETRAQDLASQLADLDNAKKQLEQLVDKINHESELLFRQNFDAIRDNFAELFRKLFGGGRAEVILEDPDNVLECGIEIVARPPGKQLQSISLLSGGEKTMTAVALLMAIFKSKPSPFCLLDEVDAALDEANTERFNLVIQEFLKDSQFVVITHARRTMSIADAIYGVTMQEQGVSKKVSVSFAGDTDNDEEETPSAVA